MATIEQEGVLSFVNEEGNIVEMYPEIKTDDTLSVSGKAADAKAVGDKIAEIEDVIDNEVATLEEKINSFDNAKPEIVGSGLGTALSMSTDDSWDDITGALGGVANKGAWNGSISTSGGSVTIPKGYHSGSGKVTGPTLANLIGTNVTLASSSKLLSGVTAYGKNGVLYTGTNKGYDAGYSDGGGDTLYNVYHDTVYLGDFDNVSNTSGHITIEMTFDFYVYLFVIYGILDDYEFFNSIDTSVTNPSASITRVGMYFDRYNSRIGDISVSSDLKSIYLTFDNKSAWYDLYDICCKVFAINYVS